ncbi:unnamed protein product [Chilo suppressalis]|uniref:ZAD domain-containing protein n=1 Tax=Chilo suppressalis TaxID=168631 RepID=A0ABN8L8X8_CHISP|nr:unnamed protein product [Chilo suppressalis]
MATECVSIKQEVDIEIAPELVIIKEEINTESLFIKQEPEDDVLSNTNAYSETTEIVPKFVNTQLEVETEPLFIKQEPEDDVLSNTNGYSEAAEIVPKFVIPQQELETEPLFIKQEPELDVLSDRNEVCDIEEMVPEFVTVKQEIEIECSDFRGLPSQINGDNVTEHANNQMEVDDGNLTIDHAQKQKHVFIIRLNGAPKTAAERGREFRARRALLRQQRKQQQEADAKVEITTDDNQLSEITTMEKRAKRRAATRRYREKIRASVGYQKKQAKTAAQRMREYRQRKKLAKKMLKQSDQDLDAMDSTSSSSQVDQRAGPSTENLQSQQQIERSEEYRERRSDNVNMKSVDPAVLERKRQLNKQRQRRYRARKRFESSCTSSHQAQTERVQSNVSPRDYEQEYWEEQDINQRNRENEKLQQTVKSETNSDSEDFTSNDESIEQTANNHTMADQPDEPMETTPITDLQLPSMSYLLTTAAPKSNAQTHREYRQRIALTRTPEQLLAARKADAERQRKCRLRKVDLALKSNAQIQREYRQRKAESRTPEQVLAARKSDAERQRKCRQRQKSNYVQTGAQQQLTNQQLRTSAAEPAQITAQPGTSAHIEVQQAQFTWNTKRASSYKSTCLGNDFGACSFCDRLCYKKDLEHITAAQLQVTSEWSIKENPRLCTEEYEMVCITCKRSLNKKSRAQIQREYRQRVAASRTPEQVLAARKSAAERQRKFRLRKDDNSTLVSGSSESATAPSSRSGAKSSDVRTGTQRQTAATEPPQIAVQPGNDFGHACSVCDRLCFKNDLEPITAVQLEVISEWYIKENRRLCREEYEMACNNCKCSLDNKSMPPLAKEIGFSWRGEREGSGMAGSGEGTPRPHHTDTAER